jgi:hypothetical protein
VLSTGTLAAGYSASGLGLLTSPNAESPYRLLRAAGGAYYLEFTGYTPQMLYGSRIGVQRFLADGSIAPGWPADGRLLTDIATDGVFPDLVSTVADSGVFIPFALDRGYTSGQIEFLNYAHRVQRLGADGLPAPGWPDSGVHVCDAPYTRWPPFAVRDGHGGVFAIWTDLRYGGSYRPHAAHVLANGVLDPAYALDGRQLTCAPGQVGRLFVEWTLSDEAGGFYLVATDYTSDYYGDLRVFRYGPDGEPAAGWPVAGVGIETVPDNGGTIYHVREDGQGGILIGVSFWDGEPQVRVARITPTGAPAVGWPAGGRVVNVFDPETKGLFSPHLAPDGRGGCWVVWEEYLGSYPVPGRCRIQHLEPSGQPGAGLPEGGLAVPSVNSDSFSPQVTEDGLGGAIIVWREGFGAPPPPPQLYAQRYLPDGVVAAEVSLVEATAEPGVARLVWHSPQAATLEARVYRRDEASEWRELSRVWPDGTGRLAYEDRDVSAGGRYAYRMGLAGGTGETFGEAVWLEVPSAHRLSLAGARPNPATSGDLTLSFTLADASPARLEVVDVTGRVVAERSLSGLGPGRQGASLADARLAPGIYWARLTQGGQQVRARFALVR